MSTDFDSAYSALRDILKSHEPSLVVVHDRDDAYYLNAPKPFRGKDLFFGSAQVKKNYVSFYLMPVYMYPDLLEGMSADLKKRMQGKSCFNFRTPEPALFDELNVLTARGLARLRAEGYV